MVELIVTHGSSADHGGYGLAAIALPKSVAFVFSDGRIARALDAPQPTSKAAIISACAQGDELLLGGDDGTLRRVGVEISCTDITNFGRKWLENISYGDGVIAASSGKSLHLIHVKYGDGLSIDHASSITGISFDARGKRLAVSHYNGATLHWASGKGTPQRLEWKGSHIGVLLSPDAKFVVTAMQELALHGWKLPEAKNMRMAGYPTKTRSMAWSAKAKWLATSGAPSVVCWPFFHKDGPMGKGPVEFSGSSGALVTAVACHPKQEILAAGHEDGSVLLFRMDDAADILVANPNGAAVSSLAFSQDGTQLGFIRENGSVGLLHLPV
jgi:Anaphase-promoting complex subunit 4 WD40 domain